jgi:hypothetical protein
MEIVKIIRIISTGYKLGYWRMSSDTAPMKPADSKKYNKHKNWMCRICDRGDEGDRLIRFKSALGLEDEQAAPIHLGVGQRIMRSRYESQTRNAETEQRKVRGLSPPRCICWVISKFFISLLSSPFIPSFWLGLELINIVVCCTTYDSRQVCLISHNAQFIIVCLDDHFLHTAQAFLLST